VLRTLVPIQAPAKRLRNRGTIS